jgi:C4-type Zn-finger protein
MTEKSIERMRCPVCGAVMNPHAEKPAVPVNAIEAAKADWILGGVIEQVHQCPVCGRVESRRMV